MPQPDVTSWFDTAREMYPDASDAELTNAYEDTYGPLPAPEPPSADYFNEWDKSAAELYPNSSPEERRASFVTAYGEPAEPPGFFENSANLATGSFREAQGSLAVLGTKFGAFTPEDTNALLQEIAQGKKNEPKELRDFIEAVGKESLDIGEALDKGDYLAAAGQSLDLLAKGVWEIVTNPEGAAYATFQQAAMLASTYAPGLATGAAGGAVGGPLGGTIGFIAGTTFGEATIETAFKLRELVEQKAEDPTDPRSILQVLQDPETMDALYENAGKKGVSVATTDMIANLLGVKLLRGIAKTSEGTIKAGSAVGRTAGTAGLQSLAGGGGEAMGEYAATGKVDWREVGPEAVLELPGGFMDVGITAYGIKGTNEATRKQNAIKELRARLQAEMDQAKTADEAVNAARKMAAIPYQTLEELGIQYDQSQSAQVTNTEQQILDSIFRKEQPLTTAERNDLEIARAETSANLPDYQQTKAIPTEIQGRVENLMPEEPVGGTRPAAPAPEPLFPEEIRPRSGHYTSQVQAEQALANKRTTRNEEKRKELEMYRAVEDAQVKGQWTLKRLTPQEIANEQEVQAATAAAEEAAGKATAAAQQLSHSQAIAKLRESPGWGRRRAGEALKTLTPVSGTGSMAKFAPADVQGLVKQDLKLSPRLPKEASFAQSITKIQDATGWTKAKAAQALRTLDPLSGTGSMAMYQGSKVGNLASTMGKQAAAEKRAKTAALLKVDIPKASSERLSIPYGQVEKTIEAKIKSVKGDLSKLTTQRLRGIPWAPKPRATGKLSKADFVAGEAPKRILSNKELDKNVKPRSYNDLREYLKWSLDRDKGDGTKWYKQFGEGIRKLVGDANLYEASVIFGVTSAQNPAESNLANTLHIMALARKYDPVANPEAFKNAVQNIKRPDGEGMLLGGDAVDRIIKMYQTGTYTGGLKISTYMQDVAAGGKNEFAPFSVQDVHMARVFGYMRRAYAKHKYSDAEIAAAEKAGIKLPAKKTSKIIDDAKFPSDDGKSIRYAQMMTGLLAKEFGIKPHEAQALLWFYAKQNLSPKDQTSDKGKTAIGDGTWKSASTYSAKEIQAIEKMIADGTFDTAKPLNSNLEPGTTSTPAKKMETKRDKWSNADFNDQILKLARERAAKGVLSFNPGNARGYGFPADTTLSELLEYHRRVLRAITDEDGQIKFLREAGVVHEVRLVLGTWDRLEPSIELTFPGETAETATWAANIISHAAMQDAAITVAPNWDGDAFGVDVRKPDNKPFTIAEIESLYEKVNPEHAAEGGLNFTTNADMTSLKFIDGRFFEGAYDAAMLEDFYSRLSTLLADRGYTYNTFSQQGDYIDHTGTGHAGNEKTNRRIIFATRDSYRSEGSSGLQRSAVDTLYKPIWRVYKYFTGRKGYKPSNQRTPLQELRRSPKFSARKLSDGQPATKEGRVTPAADRVSEKLGLPPGTFREVAVPDSLSGFVSDFVEKILGKRAIFVDGPEHFNGVTISGTEFAVHITANSPHMAVIGHELLHTIRVTDPAVYADLKEALLPLLDDYGPYRDFVNKPQTDLGFDKLSEEGVIEELIADMVGDSFMDDTFWQRVQLANPSVFERILTAIKQYMTSLVDYMRGTALEGTKYFKDYEKARNKVADVLSSHIADRGAPPSLDWIKLSQTATIEETGETVTIVQSASAAIKAADDRLVSLEKLARCLAA